MVGKHLPGGHRRRDRMRRSRRQIAPHRGNVADNLRRSGRAGQGRMGGVSLANAVRSVYPNGSS